MLRREHEISGNLNDVRNLIAYYGDKCDYASLIKDVIEDIKGLDLLMDLHQGEGITLRLQSLKDKAEQYLNILNSYKARKESQEAENEI